MKKILLFASALAGLFLAGSCQRENLEPQADKQVTFTIEAPAAMQTKAIADGLNVDELIYEVWITGQSQNVTDLSGATRLYQAKTDKKTVADGKVSFKITLDLVNDQNFTVLFWAQNSANGVYKTDELTKVTYLENANVLANYANRDAFYGSAVVSDGATETPTVTLKRPFAQVNLCTLNLKDTPKEGDYTITLDESKMTFTTVPDKFNIATGDASGEMLLKFAYNAVPGTGDNADPKDKTIKVNDKPYYYAGMNFVFADKNEGNTAKLEYDINTYLNGNEEVSANVNNTIDQIPLKQNHRTNIVGNLLTSKTDYEIIVDAAFYEPSEEVLVSEVTNSEDLQVALQQDLEHIIIDLSTNSAQTKALASPVEYTVPVNQNTFGGASTKTITINANGNILNFVYSNGDSQSIKCANPEAKIIINDATLTNSGKNNGPWNRHDIVFRHAVELNNVTSDKAIALLGNAKFTDVAISDVHPTNAEAYGLWITPLGQTVELDGVTITPSANKKTDRAIKIDPQYNEAVAALVTLNIKNSTFVSQKKAAVLVNSPVGAVINWGEGNNIEGVTEDQINAVWVDDGASDSFDLVEVNGATKVLEGAQKSVLVKTADQLQAAVNNAVAGVNEIGLGADIEGDITIRQKVGVNLVINGLDKKFDGTFFLEGGEQGQSPETLTFKNINFEHTSATAKDFISCDDAKTIGKRYAHNVTVDDCTFTGNGKENVVAVRYRQCFNMTTKNSTATGMHSLMWASGGDNITIDNVTVSNSKNGISTGSAPVVVKNSVLNVEAYGIRADGDNPASLKVENTSINATQPVIVRKMTASYSVELAGENTLTSTELYQVIFTNGDDAAAYETPTGTYTITGADDFLVFPRENYGDKVVDGLYKNGLTYNVTSAAGLKKLNEMFVDKSAGRDAILSLKNDIDFTGYTWTPVDSHADSKFEIAEINGNGHTISNLTINGQAMFTRFAGSGDVVVKDITFYNATVNSNGTINTSILTVQTYQNVLLDNVDVKNSSITGGYKVAPLIATVYNENSSTITATLKNCDVEKVIVKATSFDFCTTGMVAFVHAGDNDAIEFENCTVKDVKLYAPNAYSAHAAIYTTGSETLFNEAEGVTVTNVTFENI